MKKIEVSSGSVETMKWLALVVMVVDHINKYLLSNDFPLLFAVGRVSMPLFAFVLAYNLSRPDALSSGRYQRVLTRLAIFGLLAAPTYYALGGAPIFVMNIMFMLAVGVLVLWLCDEGGASNYALAAITFIVASALVEYWWLGVMVMISAWAFFRKNTVFRFLCVVLSLVTLAVINQNFYALFAIPIFYLGTFIKWEVKRSKYTFYWFYPVHLTAIFAIKYFTS